MTYLLTLVTPEALYFRDPIVSLMAPGVEGAFGVLAHHAPIIAALRSGPLTLTLETGKKQTYEIGSGFLDVRNNQAILLTQSIRETSPSQPSTL